MADETVRRTAGALLLAGAALVLMGTLLLEVPAAIYALVVLGLFGGVYLIGVSRPGRTV